MTGERVVLVTGVSGYWGSRVAARLVAETGYHIIGMDVESPEKRIEGLDFVRADVRNPMLAELLGVENVDTVCHLAFVETRWPSGAAFDANVMGTVKVLDACKGAGVGKVVLQSSTAVYGARPTNPALLQEGRFLRGSKRWGYTRDLIEIELHCSGFRRQAPQVKMTILRFPSILGPAANTPMARFLGETWAPSLLGFDPMMQLIHEQDVIGALVHAVINDVPGVYNVAAEDTLPLNKIRGLAGKSLFSVFPRFARRGLSVANSLGLRASRYVPIELDYIRYPWVGDLTRMREEFGFAPRYTAEETLREFADQRRGGTYLPDSPMTARDEERLRRTIEQRRKSREQQMAAISGAEEGGDDE